jgi:hypothetical protein
MSISPARAIDWDFVLVIRATGRITEKDDFTHDRSIIHSILSDLYDIIDDRFQTGSENPGQIKKD